MRVEGKIVDVLEREIFSGSIDIEDGRIVNISRHATPAEEYIIPGFIDAHLHIESSLLTPENFGALVVKHGTIGVVADPHEIANVVGRAGVDFMIESSRRTPLRSHFMIPSSVPATPFDVTGGTLSAADVEQMASSGLFVGLAEVMNVQGVVMGDGELMQKIAAAKAQDLAIDGHAPMASGEALRAYAACGITTDHECTTLEEAEEKIALGMKILIREGSAVKNYAALSPLIASNPDMVMFCTDDSHPDDIISDGHIDKIVRRAVADGYDLFDTLKIASLNPINHYRLDCGGLEIGSRADFIV
ncbi:MAG: amidohydrolase family protein, partial [Rikenellaceae bacterium]